MNASVETPELLHALTDIFTPVSGMEDLVARLASTDLRLILLSNTCRAHLEHIRSHFHVLSYFDAVTVSYEVGAMKPDEAIYLDAIAKAGCRPDECFYTDDIAAYVSAARKLKIHAAEFTGTDELRHRLAEHGIQT